MRKLAPYLIGAAILFWGFLFVLLPGYLGMEDISFDTEAAYDFNTGWSWTDAAGQQQSVTLPVNLPAAEGETVTLTRTLPDTFVPGASLCVRTSLQNIRVLVDGKEIYSRGAVKGTYLGRVFGSSWNLIRLASGCEGKTLTLELYSPYARSSGIVNAIFYGSRTALLYHIAKTYMPGFILSIALLLIGLVIFVGHFVLHEKKYNNSILLYLGLFILLAGFWTAGESKMLQFLFGNSLFLLLLPYLSLMLLPVPYLVYMDSLLGEGRHRGMVPFAWFFFANFTVCSALILTQTLDFYQVILWTDAWIGIGVVYCLVCCFYDAVAYRSRDARIQVWAAIVLLFFSVAELFNFMFSSLMNVSNYLRIGILLFVAINGVASVQKIEQLNEAEREKAYLQKLAFTDLLTGGANRTAFYRDLEKLLAEKQVITVVQFDVNGLKFINDHYGHSSGDIAIRDTYTCIQDAFGSLGTCYRMGGDEFLSLLPSEDSEALARATEQFREQVRILGMQRDYPFSVALGSSVYHRGEQAFDRIMELSDEKMYENKRSSKLSLEDIAAANLM